MEAHRHSRSALVVKPLKCINGLRMSVDSQLFLIRRKEIVPLLTEIRSSQASLEGASLNAFCTEFRQLTNPHRFCLCPCLYLQSFTVGIWIALQGDKSPGREWKDAEDPESDEQTSGFYLERPNGRGKCDRIERVNRIRSERPPNSFGVKRLDPRGSRRRQVSRTLRSGQYKTRKLPSVHPRMDCERTRRQVTIVNCLALPES